MYADRLNPRQEFKLGSMILALGMTALPIVGLVTATHASQLIKKVSIFEGTSIPLPPPPPPPKREPAAKKPAVNPAPIPDPYVPLTKPSVDPVNTVGSGPPTEPSDPAPSDSGTGTDIGTKVPPPPPPVIVGSQYDSRFNNVLQPPYPADRIRAGESGRVVVRVLIGADGRVKQVEYVSGANGSFFESTQRQALSKWRFKPATRDGVPFEQWKTMSLRFELANVE